MTIDTTLWNVVELGTLATFQEGYVNPSQGVPEYFGEDIKWLRAVDLTDSVVQETSRKLSQAGYESAGKSALLFEPGTLAISKSGTIGRLGILQDFMCGNRAVINIRTLPDKCDTRFLFYSLLHNRPRIQQLAVGSVQKNLYCDVLSTLPVFLPSMPTQKKIASVLSAYDDLIENNERRIKILEEMAQSIYREWFVNYRFPEHENVKMVDSELGEIPEGWEAGQIKDICSQVSYGYTASSQQEPRGPKFLRITDIVPDSIDWKTVPYCEIEEKNLEKHLLKEGDIVVARTGATTGYAKRINKRHPVTVYASYLVRLRIEPGSSVFAGIAVESNDYKRFIKTNIGGAAQPNANAQMLTSYPICLPPKQIRLQFETVVQDFIDQRETLQEKNQHLRQTRDLLLPKLISGELDVEELDIAVA